MSRQINVTVEASQSPDDLAMFLEVIAGDIRLGRTSGTESDYSWEIE